MNEAIIDPLFDEVANLFGEHPAVAAEHCFYFHDRHFTLTPVLGGGAVKWEYLISGQNGVFRSVEEAKEWIKEA